ncbi:DUF6123 family protein [Amphibacillus sp. Q70]|uniref:DUF6123 family protein n=1 Tax=Amphibacillus sp. Q70 TaxID=3453416 RepID=UPI003F86CC0D
MKSHQSLADYLEYLWDKGFKLTDEQVRFIYFAKKYTNSNEWLSCVALEITLKLQLYFNGSFYISLLEVLNEFKVKTRKDVNQVLKQKGIC